MRLGPWTRAGRLSPATRGTALRAWDRGIVPQMMALSIAPVCQPAAPACGGGCSPAPGTPLGSGHWALSRETVRSARVAVGIIPARLRAQPLLPAGSLSLSGARAQSCRAPAGAGTASSVLVPVQQPSATHGMPGMRGLGHRPTGQRLQRGRRALTAPADSAHGSWQARAMRAVRAGTARDWFRCSPNLALPCHQGLSNSAVP